MVPGANGEHFYISPSQFSVLFLSPGPVQFEYAINKNTRIFTMNAMQSIHTASFLFVWFVWYLSGATLSMQTALYV